MKNRIYSTQLIAGSMLLASIVSNEILDKSESKLKAKLDEAAYYLAERDSKNPEVSEASVA